jgi:hypothetical protein
VRRERLGRQRALVTSPPDAVSASTPGAALQASRAVAAASNTSPCCPSADVMGAKLLAAIKQSQEWEEKAQARAVGGGA